MPFKSVLTDPKTHDTADFVYIVHAINTCAKLVDRKKASATIRNLLDPNQFYRASLVAMLRADAALRRFGWAGGDIKQTKLYGDSFGLVINPSEEGDIYVAWHGDISSPHSPGELARFAMERRGKIEGPLTLLTRAIVHNELIIRGSGDASQILGIFVVEPGRSHPGQEFSDENVERFRRILREERGIELPVVSSPYHCNYEPGKDYSAEIGAMRNF